MAETTVEMALTWALRDIEQFSRFILEKPLRQYQIAAARAVIQAVVGKQGGEFAWIFARQSGKNETVAQLIVYLLNLFEYEGGNIILTAPARDQLSYSLTRIVGHLNNPLNGRGYRTRTEPDRVLWGQASLWLLSGDPHARVRGATAHHLIVFDEAQDFSEQVGESVFGPMCAATNAVRLYMGTAKTSDAYLGKKRRELEERQARDGRQRVFVNDYHVVGREVAAYRLFVEGEIAKKGLGHPSVVMEFACQEMDQAGTLFDQRRQAQLAGQYEPYDAPLPGRIYAATLDVAGQDEFGGEGARLENPNRDSTVGWIWEVDMSQEQEMGGPVYKAVACFADQGSRHFDMEAGEWALNRRLLAWLQHWRVAHLVSDAGGVGLGLTNWLESQLGRERVTGYVFNRATKAKLGLEFLALNETGRVLMYAGDDDHAGTFWQEVRACTYEVPASGSLETGMRWGVPATARQRVQGPEGKLVSRPIHDDYLMAAALVAVLERKTFGLAQSMVVQAEPGWGDDY
ncbi:MAG: hypothetical protein AB1791_01320 [Chloroflexota bacterium]